MAQLIWGQFGQICLPHENPLIAHCGTFWPRSSSAHTHWHTAGPGAYANMCFHQWTSLNRLCKVRENTTAFVGGAILAKQVLVLRACAVAISSFLTDSPEKGPSLPGEGPNLAPAQNYGSSFNFDSKFWFGFRNAICFSHMLVILIVLVLVHL